MVVLQLMCFAWSMANVTVDLPFLAREEDVGFGDSFQFGRSLGHGRRRSQDRGGSRGLEMGDRRSRQPRTAEELVAVVEGVSEHFKTSLEEPLTTMAKADLCAPLLVLLPLFFLPNVLTKLDDSLTPTPPAPPPTTSPPALLAQYTIRPGPPTPPSFWRPHRNLTGLSQQQDRYTEGWVTVGQEDDMPAGGSGKDISPALPLAATTVYRMPIQVQPSTQYRRPLVPRVKSTEYRRPVAQEEEQLSTTTEAGRPLDQWTIIDPTTNQYRRPLSRPESPREGVDSSDGAYRRPLEHREQVESTGAKYRLPLGPRNNNESLATSDGQPWVEARPQHPSFDYGLPQAAPETKYLSPQRVTLESLHKQEEEDYTSDRWVERPLEEGGGEKRREVEALLTRYGAQLEGMREEGEAPLSRDMVWTLMRGGQRGGRGEEGQDRHFIL